MNGLTANTGLCAAIIIIIIAVVIRFYISVMNTSDFTWVEFEFIWRTVYF